MFCDLKYFERISKEKIFALQFGRVGEDFWRSKIFVHQFGAFLQNCRSKHNFSSDVEDFGRISRSSLDSGSSLDSEPTSDLP